MAIGTGERGTVGMDYRPTVRERSGGTMSVFTP